MRSPTPNDPDIRPLEFRREPTMGTTAEEVFRRLTIGDAGLLAGLDNDMPRGGVGRLDPRTDALVHIAALIAIDAPAASFRSAVEEALRLGARQEDLLATLLAVAGIVGSARVVSAAPRIALAAGYDVEAALE
jgi:alkylhydroperoxidase/carboxymuconolactone decarboxylase family protein YurZ